MRCVGDSRPENIKKHLSFHGSAIALWHLSFRKGASLPACLSWDRLFLKSLLILLDGPGGLAEAPVRLCQVLGTKDHQCYRKNEEQVRGLNEVEHEEGFAFLLLFETILSSRGPIYEWAQEQQKTMERA
jgi:hypothetical protein